MQRREKILAAVLIAGVLIWWGGKAAYGVLFSGVEELRSQLQAIDDQVKQKETAQLEVVAATKRLKAWRAASLPSDPLDAQRLYQQWLTDLAKSVGFGNVDVTSGRRTARGDIYTGVTVDVEGVASYEQMTEFLRRFHQSGLLHRIVHLSAVRVADQQGVLDVSLSAEGLALASATQRDSLFPATTLAEAVTADAKQFRVASAAGFPSVPFQVRVGDELVTISAMKSGAAPKSPAGAQDAASPPVVKSREASQGSAGTSSAAAAKNTLWSASRASGSSVAAAHDAGTPLQAVLPAPAIDEVAYKALVAKNPFTQYVPPRPHEPRLLVPSESVLVRGWSLDVRAEVADYDPVQGEPAFSLDEKAPSGMTIDARSGAIAWTPAEDVPLGTYEATVSARQQGVSEPLSATMRIVYRERNDPPVLDPVGPLAAYQGCATRYTMAARDPDGPAEGLQFDLGMGAPAGASIDASTGVLTLAPDTSLSPGSYSVTVRVTDSGVPAETAQQVVAVNVFEDTAKTTFFAASVAWGEHPQAWLYDRTKNRRMVLHVGTQFQVADVLGRVVGIETDHLVIEWNQMEYRLALGNSLRALGTPEADRIPSNTGVLAEGATVTSVDVPVIGGMEELAAQARESSSRNGRSSDRDNQRDENGSSGEDNPGGMGGFPGGMGGGPGGMGGGPGGMGGFPGGMGGFPGGMGGFPGGMGGFPGGMGGRGGMRGPGSDSGGPPGGDSGGPPGGMGPGGDSGGPPGGMSPGGATGQWEPMPNFGGPGGPGGFGGP